MWTKKPLLFRSRNKPSHKAVLLQFYSGMEQAKVTRSLRHLLHKNRRIANFIFWPQLAFYCFVQVFRLCLPLKRTLSWPFQWACSLKILIKAMPLSVYSPEYFTRMTVSKTIVNLCFSISHSSVFIQIKGWLFLIYTEGWGCGVELEVRGWGWKFWVVDKGKALGRKRRGGERGEAAT